MKELRFALIGCGDIGPVNIAAIQRAEGCRLAKIVDVNPQALHSLPSAYRPLTTTEMEKTISSSEIDAVFIATPHQLHAPLVCQAAQRGKQVVVEKPIACTLDEADRMMVCCEKAGVALSVCHPRRYDPLVELAKELVNGGRVGTPRLFVSSFFKGRNPSYWEGGNTGRVRSGWRQFKKTSGGGVLMMNGVQQIDRMLWILGERVKKVSAEIKNLDTPVEVEDTAAVTLHFESGTLGILQAVVLPATAHKIEDRLIGTEGAIVLSPKELGVYSAEKGKAVEVHRLAEPDSASGDESKRRFLEEFAGAVLKGDPPPVPAEYGRQTLEIVMASYRAAAEENVITI